MHIAELFEEGRVWLDGHPERVFRWTGEPDEAPEIPTFRLEARIGNERVRIRRENVEAVELACDELRPIVDACRHWRAHRGEWAAVVYVPKRWLYGWSGYKYKLPGQLELIAVSPSEPRRSAFWRRRPPTEPVEPREVRALLAPPHRVAPEVEAVESIRFVGGPVDGCPAGIVYGVGGQLRLVARQHMVVLQAREHRLRIAAGEVAFVEQLALAVAAEAP